MSQVQEASLRVILAGRTGLDGALRKDPTIELLRVKTPVELIGELSQPIDDQSPADAVVVIGPEVETQVDADDMVGALRMLCPKVRVVVSTTGAPSQGGFDGVIRPDATAEGLRDLLRRMPPLPAAVAAPKSRRHAPSAMLGGDGASVPPGFIISSAMPTALRTGGTLRASAAPTASPSTGTTSGHGNGAVGHGPAGAPAAAGATGGGGPLASVGPASGGSPARPTGGAPDVAVRPAAREPVVPRQVAEFTAMPEGELLADPLLLDLHGAAIDTVSGQLEVALSSTTDDRDVLAAVTAGRSPLPSAVALMRARLGAADVAFVSGASAGTGSAAVAGSVSGAPVVVGGATVGHLTSGSARPDQLSGCASWLGGWLVLHRAYAQACRSALTDGLTGAYNRRFFDSFLPAALAQARSRRHDLSVLLLDVDNFKTFNDRYGHGAGDQILTETVRLLRSLVRADDRVCRIGGDEFAVVFFEPRGPRAPGSKHPTSAQVAAARFQSAIEAHRFPRLGAEAVGKLTISGGLATFPWDGLTAQSLLERADAALLEAKRHGKNAIVIG